MSYPPQEGFPIPATQPPGPEPTAAPPTGQYPTQPTTGQYPTQPTTGQYPTQPTTGQYPILPPAGPGYPQAPMQISGIPYGPPRAKGRATVLVLSIATALLLVFGGLMLGFYLNERGNLNDTRTNLTAQVSEQKTTVAGQQEKLTAAEKKATDLNAQLEKQKTSMADVTTQRDVLTPCMRHFEAMLDATTAGGFDAAYRATKAACDKAERKMDS